MAENPIKHSDIIQPGNPVDDAIKGLQLLQKEIKKTAKGLLKFAKAQDATSKKGQENLKKTAKDVQKLSEAEKQAINLRKQLEKRQAKSIVLRSKEGQAILKQTEALKREERELRKVAKAQDKGAKSTNTWAKATESFAFKFNALGNIVANVASTIARGFVRAVRGAISTVADFDKETRKLASILGTTRENTKKLNEEAKLLGSLSKFTATQVTTLQVALAKLGLTAEEISASTSDISKFAVAVGADLGEAAKVAAIAMRVFGKDATEMGDIVSALAVGTTKSALNFVDYETILSTLGPVARSYNFSLEDTVALTGKLRDAGFDASKASTALKNILLKLADSNSALTKKLGGPAKTLPDLIDKMIKLEDSGISLNETLEVTDRRSVAAFSEILRGADKVTELRDAVTDANEQLDEMVNEQMKALTNQTLLLKSAWEGLILSIESGDGAISKMVTGSLGFLTDALTRAANADLILTRTSKLTADQLTRTFDVLLSMSANKAVDFQGVIDGFEDVNFVLLKLDKTQETTFKNMLDDAKFNTEEQDLLWSEYFRRRELEFENDIKAREAANQRRLDEENKTAKLSAKEIIEIKKVEIEELNLLDEIYIDNFVTGEEKRLDDSVARQKKYEKELLENKKKSDEEKAKLDAEDEDRRKKLLDIGFTAAQQASDAIFDYQRRQSDAKFAAEIEAAGNNAAEIEKIQKRQAKDEQERAVKQALINGALAITKTWAITGFPTGLPAAIAQGIATSIEVASIKSVQFGEGGHGLLGDRGTVMKGPSHDGGGINLGELGEGEGDEYFGIVNKRMTKKYKDDLPAVFDSLNNGRFHDVFSRANITLNQDKVFNDPYTKMMYHVLLKQGTPYTDSEGNQVIQYPNGDKRIIKNVKN